MKDQNVSSYEIYLHLIVESYLIVYIDTCWLLKYLFSQILNLNGPGEGRLCITVLKFVVGLSQRHLLIEKPYVSMCVCYIGSISSFVYAK